MIGSFIQKLHQGVDPSRSLCNGGSGGGGSSGVKYDNLEKLYGTQQQAAGFMLDQAMPRIPGILNNTEQMVGDAMSGALADQMRGRAAYDANQSIASSNNDAIRKLTSYGAAGDPSGGRFADVMNQNAFNSAKVRAGSMNTANNYAEDQKWNRNAGMYGQVSGMSTGAMQGMSSAGAGLSNLTAQQNQNAAANAQGFGQFGAAIGSAATKADGGYIRKRRAPGLATGGDAWQAYKAANPGTTGGGGRRGYGMGQAAMQILGGASPHLLGAGIKDLMKGDKSSILKAGKSAVDWAKGAYGAMSSTPANAGLVFETGPQAADIVSGNIDAVSAGADAIGGIGAGTDAASGIGGAASGVDSAASGAGAAVDGVSAASSGVDAVSSAGSWAETFGNGVSLLNMANGGMARKKGCGLRFALGGGVRSPIAANGVDNMDASMSMPRVSQMDDKPSGLPSQAQQAAVDTRYMGKTDGMGETSAGDPDGFGKEHGDYRHLAGKGVMSYFIPYVGGALAEVVHPVGEAVSRGMVNTGSGITGSSAGAMVMDPIATTMSGKYTPQQIATDGAKENAKIASAASWLAGDPVTGAIAGKIGGLFADGGEIEPTQRADYTPGGAVRGPGTETSDDIPAWLSDGEVVHNADAVKLAGKDAMLAINDAGLQAREGKASPEEAQQAIGKVMVQRGQQLLQGRRKVGGLKLASGGCATGGKKYGLKLAGGGMLGNLGIALGAGVNQWNRQQALDMQQQQIDLQKSANQRAEEQASRAATEHEWKITDRKTHDNLRAELGDIEKRAALGDTNEYMAGKQDEAKAAAALSGIEYQPLTEEQRKVIASTPGLAKMTPHLRYEMDMQRAAALRKAGDFKSAEAYADKATSQATGDFMRSLMSGDFRSAGKLYNIYPNGHTIDGMEAGPDDDHVTVIDKGERKKVSRYDMMAGALAQLNPQAAANMLLQDKKLDAYMKRIEAQNEAKLAGVAARAIAGGSRSSGSGAGKDDGDPTASLLDRKKFNEAMGFKDEDGATADKAYSFYAQLAAANRKNGDLSAATNAELLRLSRDMATGGKKPAVDFDNNTLGFIHGVRDEGGNFRPLKSTGVRGDAIDTTTGQPFFDAKTIRTKELAGLDAFSKRDPEGFAQAAKLSQAKSERELLAMASNPQLAPFANAAILMQRYRDAPPTNKAAPGGGEAGHGVTGNKPGPFGMAADAFGGTLGFIKDGVRDTLVNNLEGEHKWAQQSK